MATPGNTGDVSSTLGELERKLRDLEQELARVGHPAATSPEPLVPPPTPIAAAPPAEPAPAPAAPSALGIAAVPPPADLAGAPAAAPVASAPIPAPPSPVVEETDARLKALEDQLDALRHYGAELQDSAGRLLEAYRSALTEAEAEAPVVPAAAIPVPLPATAAAAAAAVPEAAAPEAPVRTPIHDHQAQDEVMARLVAAQQAAAAAPPPPPVEPAPPAPTPIPVAPAALESSPAPPAPPAPPAAGPLAVNLSGLAAAPAPAAVAPDAVGAIDQRYVGAIAIDAGPFTDITSLSAFEQAIARVPGVRDVYVRGFQGQRAVIDVDLGTPTALVSELAAVTTVPFVVERADATGLVVTIPPGSPDAS